MTDLDLNAIRARVEAAREHIARNPVRPVALDFYAEDVPALLARVAELEVENERYRKALERIVSGKLVGDFVMRDGTRSTEYTLSREDLQEYANAALAAVPPPAAATPAGEETKR